MIFHRLLYNYQLFINYSSIIKQTNHEKIKFSICSCNAIGNRKHFSKRFRKEDPTKKLSTQIGELLDDNNLTSEEVDLTAQVRFTLNNEGEIVVLSVDTENDILASFVKARLNYKKVDVAGVKEGKMFTIPVRIVS